MKGGGLLRIRCMHIEVFPGGQVGSFPAPQSQGVGPHVVFSSVPNDGSLYPGFLEWLCCVKDSNPRTPLFCWGSAGSPTWEVIV